jgi:arginase
MRFGLIGAPSSAAGHWPGMEKAPAFLRLVGLPERLRENGAEVVDHGDLPQVRWRADLDNPRAQNLALVRDYLEEIAQRVDAAITDGQLPIVVGGECTVTVGAVAGFLRHHDDFGLMYLDGHIDLNTPASSSSGILDSMGMAHMLGQEGTVEELSELGPRYPMLDPGKVVYFGHNVRKMNDVEVEHLDRYGMPAYPVATLEGSISELAHEALSVLEGRVEAFALHFDVDVIRFKDFPIANVPIHNEGLSFDQAMECAEVFASSPQCVGVLITEINPDHANEELGTRFASGIARAVRGRVLTEARTTRPLDPSLASQRGRAAGLPSSE